MGDAKQVLVRTIAPVERLVTLAEAKQHLHVDTASDDDRINALIVAAELYLDGTNGVLGRALKPQTWRADSCGFPDSVGTISPYRSDAVDFPNAWRLPLPPTISITSIAYTDTAGVDQVWASSNYDVLTAGDNRGSVIKPVVGGSWPTVRSDTPNAARITFQCGYEDPSVATEVRGLNQLKIAALLFIQSMYDDPNASDVPEVVQSLIAPLRVRHFG